MKTTFLLIISSAALIIQMMFAFLTKRNAVILSPYHHKFNPVLQSNVFLNIWEINNVKQPQQIAFSETGFCAFIHEKRVELIWTTLSEKNNDLFMVERTRDGQNFEKVCSLTAAGNSSSIINYKETDYNPYPGLSYYRLVITDREGTSEYSDLIWVNNVEKQARRSTIPIVSNDCAKYQEDNEATLLILRDRKGYECFSKFIVSEYQGTILAFDVENRVCSGKYEVIASSDNELYGKRIIVKE